ncbi:MAG: hypothetical protein WCQ90_11165 [Deltaproteobacteria bacterium]
MKRLNDEESDNVLLMPDQLQVRSLSGRLHEILERDFIEHLKGMTKEEKEDYKLWVMKMDAEEKSKREKYLHILDS